MAAITKVPNGPLIKKKGAFKGSTLKSGGAIKKAQNGSMTPAQRDSIRGVREKEKATRIAARAEKEKKSSEFWRKQDSTFVSEAEKRGLTREQYSRQLERQQKQPDVQLDGMEGTGKKRNNNPPPCKGGKCTGLNRSKTGSTIKKAQDGEYVTQEGKNYIANKKVKTKNGPRYYQAKSPSLSFAREVASDKARKINDSIPKTNLSARALEMMNKKNGGMLKRADGSYSKRGLWDNIRANKGSGKKPTKQMLQQEKKIKAKTKK